jgi:PEGA domain
MEEVKRLAFALVVLASPLALADTKIDDAKAHFKSGTDLYDENNFRGALVEFQRAYELAPSYKILYNIGQVDMELQDYAGALVAYRRYLREGGADVPPARVGQVKEELEKLSHRVGRIVVQTAPGAEVLVDDIRVGFAPLPEPATVNTGRHQVTVHVTGHEADSRVIDIAGQQDVTVAIDNDLVAPGGGATGAANPQPTEPAGPPSRTAMITAWTFTGVFGVATTVTGIIALSDASTLSNLRNTFPTSKSDLDSQRSKVTTAAALTDAFGAATLVSAGLAVYLTISHHRAVANEKLSFGVAPGGAFVAGRF